jgi:hypothetical protein
MRKIILPLVLLAMAALLGGAVAIDCVRLAKAAQHRVELADAELVKNETRLVKQLDGNTKTTASVHSAIDRWKGSQGREARMSAYDALAASYRNTMSGAIDATNPLDRKFIDDAAGAMNRREVAQKQYDEEMTSYQNYLNSWRGSVAKTFSSQARLDAKASMQ